jgi:putative transposase
MFRAYGFRLWTSFSQERGPRQRYDEWQISHSYADQSGWFKDERNDNQCFATIHFSTAQGPLRRLDKAFQNFFRRATAGEEPGFPQFTSADRFNSILYPSDGIRLKGNKLGVQHVGKIHVRLRQSG